MRRIGDLHSDNAQLTVFRDISICIVLYHFGTDVTLECFEFFTSTLTSAISTAPDNEFIILCALNAPKNGKKDMYTINYTYNYTYKINNYNI